MFWQEFSNLTVLHQRITIWSPSTRLVTKISKCSDAQIRPKCSDAQIGRLYNFREASAFNFKLIKNIGSKPDDL
jgi:hypothetical protein